MSKGNPFANWTHEMAEAHNRRVEQQARKAMKKLPEVLANHMAQEESAARVKAIEQGVKDFPKYKDTKIYGTNADHRAPQGAKPEQNTGDAPHGAPQRKAIYPGRVVVCITSHRRRLIDTDNLMPKYFLDGLRYAGIILDDRPEDIELRVTQKKVKTVEEERTEILITPI